MIDCLSFLPKRICKAAVQLVSECRDFGDTGEITLEDEYISIEVFPYGLAAAPDKLENNSVMLKLIDRNPGGAAKCYAGYVIYPKSPSGDASRSIADKSKTRHYQIPV